MYTQWNIIQAQKEGNLAICSPMDRPRGHSEVDQPWDFFGRTDAKAETPVLWPPHAKS